MKSKKASRCGQQPKKKGQNNQFAVERKGRVEKNRLKTTFSIISIKRLWCL